MFLLELILKCDASSDVSEWFGFEAGYIMHVLTLAFFPFRFGAAKAQAVEAELINCHREEASQLRKVISQKEDDLHRTVQKYEEVIQVI